MGELGDLKEDLNSYLAHSQNAEPPASPNRVLFVCHTKYRLIYRLIKCRVNERKSWAGDYSTLINLEL